MIILKSDPRELYCVYTAVFPLRRRITHYCVVENLNMLTYDDACSTDVIFSNTF